MNIIGKIWTYYKNKYDKLSYNIDLNSITIHYLSVIRNIRKRYAQQQKIRVCFLVLYSSTWGARNIARYFYEDLRFETSIVIIPDILRGEESKIINLNKTYDDLIKNYSNVYFYHEINDLASIRDNYDIVFFSNPYDCITSPEFTIANFSQGNCLTIYIDYGYTISNITKEFFTTSNEILKIWRYFIAEKYYYEYFKKNSKLLIPNGVLSGYCKMDALSRVPKKKLDRPCIIITAHHTISPNDALSLSKFLDYYLFYFRLTTLYPNIDFIFRPHPLLFSQLISKNIWTSQDVAAFLHKIDETPNMRYSDEDDYYDIFVNSDAIINDCGSFIAEYLFTNKPSLFLSKGQEKDSQNLNKFALTCLEHCYKAENETDIINFIDEVIIKKCDWMKESRKSFLENELYVNYPHSSEFIFNYIKKILKIK